MTIGVVTVLSVLLSFQRICGTLAQDFYVPALFILGDSLVDDGNNNYIPSIARSNYPPYGIDFGFPTGRFCNGYTVADYGAMALGLPLVPPYFEVKAKGGNILKGINYASAAGGILDDTGRNYVARISVNQQLDLLEKDLRQEYSQFFPAPADLSDYLARSIFVLEFGSNDYINNYLMPMLYPSSLVYDPDTYARLLVNTYEQQIKRLYGLGSRKMIVVNVGPLGCIPDQLAKADTNGACVDQTNQDVSYFNHHLLELVMNINKTLPGSYFIYQDAYRIVSDILADPQKYGFTVSNRACCGIGRYGGTFTCLPLLKPCEDRDQHVFWDAFHPTQAVNEIIFKSCNTGSEYCYPMGLIDLARI